MESLAERLRYALDRKGGTQADLARACNIATPSVSNWFTGQTKSLRADTLRNAAWYLGVNRDWLATGQGEPGDWEPGSALRGSLKRAVEALEAEATIQAAPATTPPASWPLEGISRDRWAALTERQKGRVEAAALVELRLIEAEQAANTRAA
jgi:transcriptional regulator with XRE-family HTH domain